MLHSLAHLLILAVALECGYAATAISERVYGGGAGHGILLYTGTPGSEGTLGGLVAVGRRIEHYLGTALELGRLCSNDPICAHHMPDDRHEERFLHGAACHGCLLIGEPSCERRNELLDRARGLHRRCARRGILRRPVTDTPALASTGATGRPSTVMLAGLGPTALDDLASALEAGRLRLTSPRRVSSATSRARLRLENQALARDLTAQFDALVQTGALLPIHGGPRHARSG
jgi:hypothetical protein